MLMSLTLAEGKTIAIRFIFAGCCARATSGHVVAAPPISVMNSRRCMYPPVREELIDTSSLPLFGRAAGEKGQPRDPRRCDPMSDWVKPGRTHNEHSWSASALGPEAEVAVNRSV